MPFFDKNRDKAMYVLISFSRNLTTCRLDSSIAHLRPQAAPTWKKPKIERDTQQIHHQATSSVITRTNEASPAVGPHNSSEPPEQNLDTSEKHENDNDEESETYASRRDIAPFTAVRPPRQRT